MTAVTARDLLDIASDIGEIGNNLLWLGTGMQAAHEAAEQAADDRFDALAAGKLWDFDNRRLWTRDEIELARDNELKRARATALRTAQQARRDLDALVAELGGE